MSGGPQRCRYCGAPIIWCLTEKGRRMPLDAEPTPDGHLRLDSATGRCQVVGVGSPEHQHYTSHFATCPRAAEARKGGRRAQNT